MQLAEIWCNDAPMEQIKHQEWVLPSVSLIGFGFVITFVLSVASGYAISTPVGVAVGTALFVLVFVGFITQIFKITVTDKLIVGKFKLPLELIADAQIFVGSVGRDRFRAELKTTDLVIGSSNAANYLRIVINDPADPYQVWFVPTRKPEKLLAAVNHKSQSRQKN
jgi:UDP-N-acetylmuramyl pentapeptide phosphotransferase/UDP-N-acetylglucosamine-1-phosphate transferase